MDQKSYLQEIPKTSSKSVLSYEEFRSLLARFAYASFPTFPDALVFIAYLSQFTEEVYTKNRDESLKIFRKAQKTI